MRLSSNFYTLSNTPILLWGAAYGGLSKFAKYPTSYRSLVIISFLSLLLFEGLRWADSRLSLCGASFSLPLSCTRSRSIEDRSLDRYLIGITFLLGSLLSLFFFSSFVFERQAPAKVEFEEPRLLE